MSRRRQRSSQVVAFTAGWTLLCSGPARAAAPDANCGVGPAERTQIRDFNTRAKQDFEEENYLAAAQQWLLAQAVLRGEEDACFVQRSTRVDLAQRAYRGYRQARSFKPDERPLMAEAARLLAGYLEVARRRGADDERLTQIEASRGELECLANAEPEATGVCLGDAPVATPAEAPPPVVFLQAPARAQPVEVPPKPAPRGLQLGLGIGLGVGVAATAAALATWSQARRGGPMHREIRDAAAASLADGSPDNDVSPTLSADQDYCVVARAGDGAPRNEEIAGLCDRHDRMRDASIAMTAIAGVGAAASVVFAALLLRHRKSARASARAANLHALPLRGGFVIGGGMRF